MVEPLKHRQTKGGGNGYVLPNATAPHLDSTHLRHATRIEQCPSSRAKLKTCACTEFFSVWPKSTSGKRSDRRRIRRSEAIHIRIPPFGVYELRIGLRTVNWLVPIRPYDSLLSASANFSRKLVVRPYTALAVSGDRTRHGRNSGF